MWTGRLVNPVGEGTRGSHKAPESLITPECWIQPAAALNGGRAAGGDACQETVLLSSSLWTQVCPPQVTALGGRAFVEVNGVLVRRGGDTEPPVHVTRRAKATWTHSQRRGRYGNQPGWALGLLSQPPGPPGDTSLSRKPPSLWCSAVAAPADSYAPKDAIVVKIRKIRKTFIS